MRYSITIEGRPESPGLLCANGFQAIDTDSELALRLKTLVSKRGSNITAADRAEIRRLKCLASLWLSPDEKPVIPATAFRRLLEDAARATKEGPKVRGGLVVTKDAILEYDRETLGDTADAISRNAQMTCGVVVSNRRIEATRACFPQWKATFEIDTDDELVDMPALERWLDVGGRRVGIGSWRPAKSGTYGRFRTVSIDELPEEDA